MRYQDVYPSALALDSGDLARGSAAELPALEYFEAEPGTMYTGKCLPKSKTGGPCGRFWTLWTG
jgi:hypothetical protein